MSQRRTLTTALAAVFITAAAASASTQLTTELLASGFAKPLWAGSPPGDKDRIFVVEQSTAQVRIFNAKTGVINGPAYLAILSKVNVSGNERGLLGFAFDPNYDTNQYVYVSYNQVGTGASIIERYQTLSTNPDRADLASGTIMLGPVTQPNSNHNGGNIAFGPDGYLYFGLGDGGGAGDTSCNAQKGNTLLGKMLRLDTSTVPASAAAGNPFIGNPNFDDRIWAYGLRNPWRWSFDAANGDLYIGDVGQNAREEVDWVPGTSVGGENYGWKVMEGFNCFSTSNCLAGTPTCNAPSLTDPVVDYSLSGSPCTVVGGFVYRGCAIPDLQGTYFYADYCSGVISSFELVGGVPTNQLNRKAELDPPGTLAINNITSFGVDACGELLIVDQSGGEIYRVVPATLTPAGTDLGFGKANGAGETPELSACGLLDTGNTAQVSLTNAPASTAAILFASVVNTPAATVAGTLITVPPLFSINLVTNADGEIHITAPGGSGPFNLFLQYVVLDPTATFGASSSNGLQLNFLP